MSRIFLAIILSWLSLSSAAIRNPAPRQTTVKADRIVVWKSREELWLYSQGTIIRKYWVSLGPNPVGHKVQEGDGRTPEGQYMIIAKNAGSDYHLSLMTSYPNDEDRARAKELGVNPGDKIMIHGLKNGWGWVGYMHLLYNWTRGCIAVTDGQIEEIWNLVDIGTPVEINP